MKEKGIDMSDTLTYNGREELVIPEYGRGIQTMVQHMMSIADRAERTKCAEAIVSVMGSVVPPEGTEEEESINFGTSCTKYQGIRWMWIHRLRSQLKRQRGGADEIRLPK